MWRPWLKLDIPNPIESLIVDKADNYEIDLMRILTLNILVHGISTLQVAGRVDGRSVADWGLG